MNDLTERGYDTLSAENMNIVATVVREMMTPIMESIAKMLEHNTQAMDQIAAAQQITNDRIEALEKQVRLNTPMSAKQVQYLNDAIRARARDRLDKYDFADDKKAVTKLSNIIRKDVLSRYGVASLREVPKHQYSVALSQIGTWSDTLSVRDVVKEAREREDMAMALAESSAGVDGEQAAPGPHD